LSDKMGRGIEYKRQVVKDLSQRFSAAQSIVLVDFSGVSVSEVTALRSRARQQKVDYLVAKNNLIKRAISGTPLECLDSDLTGPTALGIGYDGSLAIVKLLSDSAKDCQGLKIRAGFVDGEYASAADIEAIAKLPDRPELLAKLMGALQAPVSRLVFTLRGTMCGLVRALEAIKEKKEGDKPGASA